MKKDKTLSRKLVLRTETIKKLTAEQLQAVDAGLRPGSGNDDSTSVLTVHQANCR